MTAFHKDAKMHALSTLADEFAHYETHQPIPAEQRELVRTLFYYGAACVIDCIGEVNHGTRTVDDVCAALERMRREVQDVGVQHVLGKILEDVAAHGVEVHVTPIEPH
jgi:hypothetical protein